MNVTCPACSASEIPVMGGTVPLTISVPPADDPDLHVHFYDDDGALAFCGTTWKCPACGATHDLALNYCQPQPAKEDHDA